MRKKVSLLLALAGVVMLTSCDEKGALGVILEPQELAEDTTYVGTVATAQPRKMLVEEFTGATCPNCPDAQALLSNLNAQNGERLATMAIHVLNNPQTRPVKNAKYDFRTQDGTDAGNTFFGTVNNLPIAGLDRVKNAKAERLMQKNDWAGVVSDRLKVTPPVNVDVTSTYTAATREALIEVKVAYTKAMEGQQFLSVALVEDGMVDKQDSTGIVIENYTFKHVLRDYITPVAGVAFLKADQKPAGTVYIRRFKFKVDDKWEATNCHLIAFVHNNNGEDKEVLQAADAHLTEQ